MIREADSGSYTPWVLRAPSSALRGSGYGMSNFVTGPHKDSSLPTFDGLPVLVVGCSRN